MKKFILDKSSPLDVISVMGGKARNLYLMETQKIKTPSWFCISIDLYLKYYSLIEDRINILTDKIKTDDVNFINEVSEKINHLFDYRIR